MLQTGSARPLFVQLRFFRMGYYAKRRLFLSGWQQGANRIERLGVIALLIVFGHRVPWIQNDAIRLETPQRAANIGLELRVTESQSKRRWFAYPNPVLDFLAIERR